jgi:hypothetical protein
MSEDIEESRFAQLEAVCKEYAEAQAQFDYLDEFTKSKLALLMKAAEAQGAKSAVIQEREARSDAEFMQFLKGKQVAQERALALKWKLETTRMRFEWARTKAANRRAEMNLR